MCVTSRLEQGDFKLRVRAPEVERQNERNKLVQKSIFSGVLSCMFLNAGTALSVAGRGLAFASPAARAAFVLSVIAGLRVPYAIRQINKLDKNNERFGVK